jgi:hypothetical protein
MKRFAQILVFSSIVMGWLGVFGVIRSPLSDMSFGLMVIFTVITGAVMWDISR